jgi:hypothetical protein
VSVVCCQVEFFASDWSLVQRSPTDYVVSECHREASIMRKPWPTRVVEPWKKKALTTPLQITSFYIFEPYLLKKNVNISLPSMPSSPKWFLMYILYASICPGHVNHIQFVDTTLAEEWSYWIHYAIFPPIC